MVAAAVVFAFIYLKSRFHRWSEHEIWLSFSARSLPATPHKYKKGDVVSTPSGLKLNFILINQLIEYFQVLGRNSMENSGEDSVQRRVAQKNLKDGDIAADI